LRCSRALVRSTSLEVEEGEVAEDEEAVWRVDSRVEEEDEEEEDEEEDEDEDEDDEGMDFDDEDSLKEGEGTS